MAIIVMTRSFDDLLPWSSRIFQMNSLCYDVNYYLSNLPLFIDRSHIDFERKLFFSITLVFHSLSRLN